jgi:hypothetical protein
MLGFSARTIYSLICLVLARFRNIETIAMLVKAMRRLGNSGMGIEDVTLTSLTYAYELGEGTCDRGNP